MGMEQTVTFPSSVPAWDAISTLLAGQEFPLQVRMIDGELAFPDELPSADWRELRVSTPQGMVTLRRGNGQLILVTWGNADPGMLQAWNALTWACAHAGAGQIQTPDGPVSPDEYRRSADLPESLRR